MPSHLYYADLNCPFCYALHERLRAEQLDELVEWRGIRHVEPKAISAVPRAEIESAVRAVRQKVPGLTIVEPEALVDSAPATLLIAEMSLSEPRVGARLREALYRAFWVDGRDISDSNVLEGVCRSSGVVAPTPGQRARTQVETWQREWEQGPFGRRLPVLVSPNGAVSIGLEGARRTALFLRAGVLSSLSPEHCVNLASGATGNSKR